MTKAKDEALLCLRNEKGDLYGIVARDEHTHQRLFYKVSPMDLSDIRKVLDRSEVIYTIHEDTGELIEK